MKRMVFLTPTDSRPGFLLAGLDQPALEETTVEATLQELASDSSVGLVVVDERLLPQIASETLTRIEERGGVLLAILPAPEREEAGAYALDLIRRAIGYHVRLRP